MRLNLTQHVSTSSQECVEPSDKEAVQDLLTFEEIPSRGEIAHRAVSLAEIAAREGATEAMIGGAPFLMPSLEAVLIGQGIMPVYAFSRREVVESKGKDGSVTKKAVFNHIGFVEAAETDIVDSCRRMQCGVGGYTKIVDGRIIYQAVSCHPRKDRRYAASDRGEAAPGTSEALTAAGVVVNTGLKWKAAVEEKATTARETWIESLPDTLDLPWEYKGRKGVDTYTIDKDREEIQDEYGNYYLSLPQQPVKDIVGWIKENEYIPE